MKTRILKITTISIIIGLFTANGFMVLSGMNQVLTSLYFLVILTLFVFAIILIIKEPIRKLKIVSLSILTVAIVLGIFINKRKIKSLGSNTIPPRIYYEDKTE